MKTINLKFASASVLLFSAFFTQGIFAGAPVKSDPPSNSPMLSSSMLIDLATPVTYDILGSYLAVSFNSPDGTAVVTIENKNGSIIYQSVVDTNTESELLIPIKGWKSGTYTLSVSSQSTNFISAIHL